MSKYSQERAQKVHNTILDVLKTAGEHNLRLNADAIYSRLLVRGVADIAQSTVVTYMARLVRESEVKRYGGRPKPYFYELRSASQRGQR